MKLGVEIFFFKIPIGRTIFGFSSKTLKKKPRTCSFFVSEVSEVKVIRFGSFVFYEGWDVYGGF